MATRSKGAVRRRVLVLTIAALILAACNGESIGTTLGALPDEETTSTAGPVDTTTSTSTTTTTIPPTTTTTIPADRAQFVGWWTTTSEAGIIDMRVLVDGSFMLWDSASGLCRANGLGESPMTWAGVAQFHLEEVPRMTITGTATCFPYEGDPGELGEISGELQYDSESGTLLSLDGVNYNPVELITPPLDDNPFVGSWEATDSDGTHIMTVITPDGIFNSEDTRSGGCENMGLTGATWSASGVGIFDLGGAPAFEVPVQTLCHPPDGEPVPRSEGVFSFGYVEETDELVLHLFLDTVFTRVR